LIPRYGAIGAAAGASAGLMVHNLLKQVGLRLVTGLSLFDVRYSGTYVAIGLATISVLLTHWALPGRPFVVLTVATVVSIALFLRCKRVLRVSDVFPEVRRVPLIGALLA